MKTVREEAAGDHLSMLLDVDRATVILSQPADNSDPVFIIADHQTGTELRLNVVDAETVGIALVVAAHTVMAMRPTSEG